jgi:hypothetical protein
MRQGVTEVCLWTKRWKSDIMVEDRKWLGCKDLYDVTKSMPKIIKV